MIIAFIVSYVVFIFFHTINFFLSSYFIQIDIFMAILVFISIHFSDYRGNILAVLWGIIFGSLYGMISIYIFTAVLIKYIFQLLKEHFLINSPVFLFAFSFIFTSLKALAYFIYVGKLFGLTSLLVTEYLFDALITSLFSYPAFIFLKKLYSQSLRIYEKGLRYS